ncbi:YopX family protein [Weissella fangxianensis]|uniref:YopX family protein n=1 Tax=Weissella fangxianensis TaxID=2953879 RepID=UPI00215801BF|nr:YopX family protein [Weissella fangxianensis]
MREIKFRVWNSMCNEYRSLSWNTNNQNLGLGFEVSGGIGSNVTTMYHSVGDTVEQYTGMTDKNGVEIYEGDIIQTSTGELQTVVGITPIYINEDIYTLVQATKSLSGEIFILDNSDVVIGNIHENPELLEADE